MPLRDSMVCCALVAVGLLAPPMGQTPCLAAAKYNLSIVGAADGGNPYFDAQGNINSTTQIGTAQIRHQSGPYSISFSEDDDRFHTLARLAGSPDVVINPAPKSVETPAGTVGSAVNSSGTIVGTQYSDQDINGWIGKAISFTRDGGTQLVPTPLGGYSSALSINDAGLIVGRSAPVATNVDGLIIGKFDYHAFLSDGQSSWDLNTLIDPQNRYLLTSATDINSRGQILGLATDTQHGGTYEFLLTPTATPTPEPSTLLILAGGSLVGLAAHRRAAARRGHDDRQGS